MFMNNPFEGMLESVRRKDNFPKETKPDKILSKPEKVLSRFNLSIKVKEVRVPPDIYDVMKNAQGVSYDAANDKMVWIIYPVISDSKEKDIKFIFDQSVDEVGGENKNE